MKLKLTIIMLLITGLLAACNDGSENASNDLAPEELKQLINDYSTGDGIGQSASITATELVITSNDNKKTVHDLPKDEFFVSIAPYMNVTHPCTNHSLTGCQGELVDRDIDLYIEDEDGNVILEDTMNTGKNGFIDLWLPRDQTYMVKMTYDGKEVESNISTFDNDGTCITTMQLI
ncbi:CueP family metal-binding protein [Lentibacillus saliphilus]|uniref:CueP family metal-binding protein n=1 Tax=Lentibacillus saliphilus TaxID=2737028 RepID=UPI001C3098D8|nr:CueP family metal-binding protein [Lentibacillus saliphilus]